MAILTCPGCGRGGLRVPDGRRGKVTCPRCGAEWFYPETVELNEVEFRCSHTGARFIVQLARRSPLHKFVIQGIKNSPPCEGNAPDESPASPSTTVAVAKAPSDQLDDPKRSNWLARIFKAGAGLSNISRTPTTAETANSSPTSSALVYDANEYNWSSFFCPYCHASSFIRCAGGHLACDSAVEMRNGRRFHQCFCGNAGFIEGTIESFKGRGRTIEEAHVVSKSSGPAPRENQLLQSVVKKPGTALLS